MAKVICIMLLLLLCSPIYSQVHLTTDSTKIDFRKGSALIDTNLGRNSVELEHISSFLKRAEEDSLISISKIVINSYASPDGGCINNRQLTKERSNAIYDYLTKIISKPDSLIKVNHSGINWIGLYALVEKSDMKYRDDVLNILKNTPEERWGRVNPNDKWLSLVDSRLKRLKDLRYGKPYHYMVKHFFPLLRSGSIVTYYSKNSTQLAKDEPIGDKSVDAVKLVEEEVAGDGSIEITREATSESITDETTAANTDVVTDTTAKVFVATDSANNKTPITFAIKTNLLYYAILTPSIELEVPISNRWSVAGEWVFPWWIFDNGTATSSRSRYQLLNGNIEGKYWFGNRSSYDLLTGWYCGLYSGAGLYDIEYKGKGYQGELFIAAGLSGGYAHTINKQGSLRMEYSLSMGYLNTKYRYYEAVWGSDDRWHPVREKNGNYSWLGPTRARISLVWMIGNKHRRGGKYD